MDGQQWHSVWGWDLGEGGGALKQKQQHLRKQAGPHIQGALSAAGHDTWYEGEGSDSLGICGGGRYLRGRMGAISR